MAAELRRLLIESVRLKKEMKLDRVLDLNPNENHYLKRVLRLRSGDSIAVVDGIGHLWEATLGLGDTLKLSTPFDCPIEEQFRPNPLIGVAVVLPKRGFDELLRMSCEIGVDIIQPLSSERGVIRMNEKGKTFRRDGIIKEAVEQSERLWAPKLRRIIDFKDWVSERPSKATFAFAVTRVPSANDLQLWMMGLTQEIDQLWVAIGPEGGWTQEEILFAKEAGCIEVQFGKSILRTSTAAVAVTQSMVSWRQNSFSVSSKNL